MPGHVARVVLACPPQPFAEIGADRSDAILPHAVDRRGKIVPDNGRPPPQITVSSFCHAWSRLLGRTGSRSSSRRRANKLELDVVDQRPALQGIQLVDCLRNLARCEAMDRLEEKSIGAASVVLEGGWRIAPDPQRVSRHDRPDDVRSARSAHRLMSRICPSAGSGFEAPGRDTDWR